MKTSSMGALTIMLALTACSSRTVPAPVVELYQGNTIYDYERAAYDEATYTVKKGDTLYSVAWHSGQDFRQLAHLNNIPAPYNIFPGQVLQLNQTSPSVSSGVKSSPGQTTKVSQSVDRKKKQAYGDNNRTKKHTVTSKQGNALTQTVKRWIWPAKGNVSETFSLKDQGHKGLDINGKRGDMVKAAADGKVVYTGNALRGYGNLVIIKHSEAYLSAYAHNDEVLVREQDWVKAGQKIASMGSSGTDSVKLHFEVRYRGKSVDPMRYLPTQ